MPSGYCPTGVVLSADNPSDPDNNHPVFTIATTTSGDVNGDAVADTIVELDMTHCYSNGIEPFLVVLVNDHGSLKQVASRELEERSVINTISIENNTIVVDETVHSKTDGACCPSVHKIAKFKLVGDTLVTK